MRLFTAIGLPEPILYRLETFLVPLRPLAQIRWSPSANLHITTRFIGEWPVGRLPELSAALTSLATAGFEVTLAGVGWFPNAGSPHVFWMGVQGGDSLRDLAAQTDLALAELGCLKEQRVFTPHLTLARMVREADLRRLRHGLAAVGTPVFLAFAVTEFHLYQSDAGIYRKLETFSLVRSIK